MNELAADPVRTVHVLMELLTQPRLVSRCYMPLFLQLVLTVGKRACITVVTMLRAHPALAQLCLYLQLVVPRHDTAVAAEREWVVLEQRLLALSIVER